MKNSAEDELIPLALLVAEIEATTGEICPIGTRVLREWATDRKIPAVRQANGRWAFLRSELPKIITSLPPVRIFSRP